MVERKPARFLHLPFPPSANAYWRWGKGRMHRTKRAKDYIETVRLHAWGIQIGGAWQGDLSVSVEFFPPASQRGPVPDLDNLFKVLFDAMTQAGFWEDDNQVKHLDAALNPNSDPAGLVHVRIAPLGVASLLCHAKGTPCDR